MTFADEVKRLAKVDGLFIVGEGYDWRPDQDADVILLAREKQPSRSVACSASGLEQLQATDMPALAKSRYDAAKRMLEAK